MEPAMEGSNRPERSGLLVVAFVCFFVSGMSGLVYEVVWTRMLTQVYGHTTYAVATVLTAFMAGLALGSYLFGLASDRCRNNFLFYGLLEAGVGIYGLLVPWIFNLVRSAYVPLFSLNQSFPLVFNLILFLLSFVFLMVPTLLMGATLPVLSRFFIRNWNELGRRLGFLYAINTVGAVVGCAAAGYWLIPALGMRATVFLAALLNLIVAGVIFAVDWTRVKTIAVEQGVTGSFSQQDEPATRPSWLGSVLLLSIGFSGFSALVYENSWARALTMVIGSSVYSFTTMLVTFLAGLSLGGFLYSRIFGKRPVGIGTFAVIEVLVGIAALLTLPLFERLPFLSLRLLVHVGDSFSLLLAVQLLLCALIMLLPTTLLGMTFPLVSRLFTQDLYEIGRSVGISYAANTFGAIVGAFSGGFVLIPMVGVQNTIILGVVVNLLVGWSLLLVDARRRIQGRLALGVAVLAAAVLIPLKFPRWDPHVVTSGVAIYDDTFEDLPTDDLRLKHMRSDRILYYREGLTATVSVHEESPNYRYFKTNGKVDGSHGDALTQAMLGYIPLFLYPDARRVAVVGLGTGMTAKVVSDFSVREIEVLEIEPAIIEAAAYFNDLNGNVLHNPRVRIILTDARNYIVASRKRYDVIISEPSNPWIAGVANLYTREFYEAAKSKLNRDGIFAQWIHNYSMSPEDLRMVFRTFAESFDHVSLWEFEADDFLLVGGSAPQVFDLEALRELYDGHPTLRGDLEDLGLADINSVLSYYRMGAKELRAFAHGARINSDDRAELEYSAPKNLRRDMSDLNRELMQPFIVAPPWPGIETLDYFVEEAV